MNRRNVCVVTGTRAEYGLLLPLIKLINEDEAFGLKIIATGMHLSPEFGMTYREIEEDGFIINKKIEILLSSDTSVGISKSIGLGIISFSEAYAELSPDIIILLGDRFELFAASVAAQVFRIPIAHIHGGETTLGAIDEAFRHSITKMSHLHFTSTKIYRRRVIQLGEKPERVFNVGALGVENIRNLKLLNKQMLEEDIGFDLGHHHFLVTYHPVTLERGSAELQFNNLLESIDQIIRIPTEVAPLFYKKDRFRTKIVFTKANADTDGRVINRLIDEYVAKHQDYAIVFDSLGHLRYLSVMKHAIAVVGNSSSGIIEAPSLCVPTVNIGDRQKGRVRAGSIIDCDPDSTSITESIIKAMSPNFCKSINDLVSPYEKPGTALEIKNIIKNVNLASIIKKEFYDFDEIQKCTQLIT